MRYLVLAMILLLVACGGGDDNPDTSTAEGALRQQFSFLDKGQWGRQWDALHPAHQVLVSRQHFTTCAEQVDFPSIDGLEVLETYEEETSIPGTDQTVASTAITVEIKISQGLLEDELTDTFHEVLVDGEWRWLISDVTAYEDGGCPQ